MIHANLYHLRRQAKPSNKNFKVNNDASTDDNRYIDIKVNSRDEGEY